MISEGAFWKSVNEAKILINKLKILRDTGNKKGIYSQRFLSVMHSDNYAAVFDTAAGEGDYEIMITDGSFFQFSMRKDVVSMSFFPRPSKYVSYKDYVYEIFKDEIIDLNEKELVEFEKEILSDGSMEFEYEQYLIELGSLKNVTPVRFDYDLQNYSQIYHPLCHLHFGVDNDIRIAIDKHPTPLIFSLFILKNFFSETFFVKTKKGRVINPDIYFPNKEACNKVPDDKFENENSLIYFT